MAPKIPEKFLDMFWHPMNSNKIARGSRQPEGRESSPEMRPSTGVEEETQIHRESVMSSRNGDHPDEELDERYVVMSSVSARDEQTGSKSTPKVRRSGRRLQPSRSDLER
ncbi:hypothetical protein U9M48_028516 [Paspalum notatum var. saurae]|uniref:Uncharacterized protein n=1 Tax=Paspalum notatum var. saurae TaxID=547442 RepID=A0AAQ3X1M9_PASNO